MGLLAYEQIKKDNFLHKNKMTYPWNTKSIYLTTQRVAQVNFEVVFEKFEGLTYNIFLKVESSI